MNNSGFQLDSKDFDLKYKNVVENTIPGLAEKGLAEAMIDALNDADHEEPYIPVGKTKHLRGSKTIKPAEKGHSEISILGGFNCPYAAKWHELEPTKAARINWTRAGSGPKYLEAKLIRNRNKYMKKCADWIRAGQK